MPIENLTDRRFGRLTVKTRGPDTSTGRARWYCQCDCGNPERILVRSSNLKSGNSRSCGCLNKEAVSRSNHTRKPPRGKIKDMTGRRFGRLLVKERGPNTPARMAQWWCECGCGNPERVLVVGSSLRQGITRSCGCLRAENVRSRDWGPFRRNRVPSGHGTLLPASFFDDDRFW